MYFKYYRKFENVEIIEISIYLIIFINVNYY